jgi:chemotaxis signal transduction protein
VTGAGFVLFRLGGQTFVTGLDAVREIVRLDRVSPLPGARPPLVGVTTLRGLPLPVLDTRPAADAQPARGDVLVVNLAGGVVGVAVDQVLAVLAADDLTDAGAPAQVLPAYVVGVLRYEDAPVFLVDLLTLLDGTGAGWQEVLGEVATA